MSVSADRYQKSESGKEIFRVGKRAGIGGEEGTCMVREEGAHIESESKSKERKKERSMCIGRRR